MGILSLLFFVFFSAYSSFSLMGELANRSSEPQDERDSLTNIIYEYHALAFELQKIIDEKFDEINREVSFILHENGGKERKNLPLALLRKQQEILIALEKENELLKSLIQEYEETVNILFKKTLLRFDGVITEEKTIELMNKLAFRDSFFRETLQTIEKEIRDIAVQKNIDQEKEKKTKELISVIGGEKKKETKITHEILLLKQQSDEYQNKLLQARQKIIELKKKIGEMKKIIIIEDEKQNKIYLNEFLKQKKLEKNKVFHYINKKKSAQRTLFLQRDRYIKQIKETKKECDTFDESSLQKKSSSTDLFIDIAWELVNTSGTREKEKKIFETLLKREYDEQNLSLVEMELFALQKELIIVDAWLLLEENAPHTYSVESLIKNIDYEGIKNKITSIKSLENFEEVLREVEKIFEKHRTEDEEMIQRLQRECHTKSIEIEEKRREVIESIEKIYCISKYLTQELQSKSFWGRSAYSIDWENITSFFPSCKNVANIVNNAIKKSIKKTFSSENPIPWGKGICVILFVIIAIFFGGILGKYGEEYLNKSLFSFMEEYPHSAKLLTIITLGTRSLIWWYAMGCSWLLVRYIFNSDIGTALVIIFLFTPLLLIIFSTLYYQFLTVNEKRGFSFLSLTTIPHFKRFYFLFFFPHSILFCLRWGLTSIISYAFYQVSSLLSVIRAAQFLLLQVNALTLLRKEMVLNIIPTNNPIGKKVQEFFSRYYRFILSFIALVIIMSNPYVGYGTQVLYIISRVFATVIFIPLLYKIFDFIKNISIDFFIDFSEGESNEKFYSGKSLYVITTALLFFFATIASILFFCVIWGIDFNISLFSLIAKTDLIGAISSAQTNTLTLMDITKVFLFLIIGYILAYIINNFIIGKIVNPIIMGPQLQYTFFTIIRYVLVLVGFFVGLYAAGLQSLTTKIALVIGIFSFALKEPFADFISYFIILIQRPIKIGDFIRISDSAGDKGTDITGIVRKITPRTTILRQKNSVTIVVPNAVILSKLLYNWNYHRTGYVGLDDILLHVSFRENPELVRSILIKAVEGYAVILKNPYPIVRCEDFTPSGYQFLVRGFVNIERAHDLYDLTAQLRIILAARLTQEGIALTPPHTVILLDERAGKKQE